MYSPLKIILMGAALAAATPIFPNITLTVRSTKSFPPNSTNGTAPHNGDPTSRECRIADFGLHMCMTQPEPFDPHTCDAAKASYRKHCLGREEILDPVRKPREIYHQRDVNVPVTVATNGTAPNNGAPPYAKPCEVQRFALLRCQVHSVRPHECDAEQAAYRKCKGREEILDFFKKLREAYHPEDPHVPVTVPTNDTAPHNGTHRVELHPVPTKWCVKELHELEKCKASFDPFWCQVEHAKYKECRRQEEIRRLIWKIIGGDQPIYSNITIFPRTATDGTAPTNDDPPVNGDLPIIPLEPCEFARLNYEKCKTTGHGSHECVAEQGNYSQCKKHEEVLDLIRKMFGKDPPVDANATVFARAAADGTAPTNDDPPVNGDLPIIHKPCLPELAKYLKCKKTGHGSHECVIERRKYHLCKEREGGDEELLDIPVADDPEGPVASVNAPTNDDPLVIVDPILVPEPCKVEREQYEKCKSWGGNIDCLSEHIMYRECMERERNEEGPVVFARAPTMIPVPDSLPYMLTKCNAKGYAKCLSEGREDCDANLAKLHGCVNQHFVKWLFAPGPKPKVTKGLSLTPNGKVFRDGELIGNVYDVGAKMYHNGDIVLYGRIIGNVYGYPDV